MNKDLLDQLPADERPAALTLTSVAEDMQLSPAFRAYLEEQLMNTPKVKEQSGSLWYTRLLATAAWMVFAAAVIALLNWTIHSMVSNPPPAAEPVDPSVAFESGVRQGKVCAGPLTLAH